jgi:hypothetical protein
LVVVSEAFNRSVKGLDFAVAEARTGSPGQEGRGALVISRRSAGRA